MRKIRKMTQLGMVAVMTVSLFAGCGSSADSGTASDGAEAVTDTQQQEQTADSGTSDGEVVELNYFTWVSSADKSYPANMIAAFEEKYPNIKVNVEYGSQNVDEYLQMQKVKLLSGKNLDVTTIRAESRQSYTDAGYLLDLSGEDFLNAYSQDYLDMVSTNGSVYCMPYGMDVMGVIYNKAMFEEHGWQIPDSYESYLALCDEIAAEGITPAVQGYKDSWPMAMDLDLFMNRAVVEDPDIYSKIESGEAKYTDPMFQEIFTDMNEYFQTSAVDPNAIGMTYDQACSSFATGQAAMMIHGEWAVSALQTAGMDFEIGVFPVPLNKEGEEQRGITAITSTQVITSFSEHPEEAKLFLEFMSTPEAGKMLVDGSGNFSPVEGVEADAMTIWQDLLKLPSTDFYTDMMGQAACSEMYKATQMMFIGEMTPEEALEDIQQAQEQQ